MKIKLSPPLFFSSRSLPPHLYGSTHCIIDKGTRHMMIKSKFSLDDVGVQLETSDEGLRVAFYLDAEYGIKPICRVLLGDLIGEYIGKANSKDNLEHYSEEVMLFNAEQLMYEFDFFAAELQQLIEERSNDKKKCNSTMESMDDVYPDSGFGDDF